MTAFVANNGADNFFDAYTGGSVNATLDTYTISKGSRLIVRTDSYACANHTSAFGSLDTVSFTGTGGTLRFDPTYVRVIAYTAGSGNSPAYGSAISQGGVSGVFLGAWANWLSDPVAVGAAIPASGFIKIGGATGGSFAAGALTGITATCSGPDVQGWIEVRGADTASITIPRVGKMESVEAWFEIGTTNGTRGQIIPCPTTATVASTFPGVWIETSAGSGIYEPYASVGTVVALATHRTDASMKVITQTTGGIRIGNDGTNGVFFLPPTGCKVRIPATILTTCTRTAGSGSGPRVLPNATLATRQELVTTGAGYVDMRGAVIQWYMNLSQAFFAKYKACAMSDTMVLSKIASPVDVDDCIVAPTAAQLNFALNIASCFEGGTIQNSVFNRFSLASSGAYVAQLNYVTGVTFSGNIYRSATLRANGTTGCITSTAPVNCTFTNETFIGGRGIFSAAQRCVFNNTIYYDHTITTTTTATNPMMALVVTGASANNTVNGFSLPLPANGPYSALISLSSSYNTLIKNIGSSYSSPLVMNASVTGLILVTNGNNDGIVMKRCYVSNTRTGPYSFLNSDTNVLLEHVSGDAADASVLVALNTVAKNCLLAAATSGQVSVYGTHWMTRFTSTTAGFAEILCNEPTATSAAQCQVTGGTPQFNSSGSVLLTKVGDQITWEMPFFAVGYTAFTNSAPTITGTNVTFSSGSTWGNHTLEYQVDTGSGYGGTWLPLNATSLISNTFNGTTGFKLKIRATCLTANAGNVLTNLRVALTTTQTDRDTKLYPLSVNTVTFTGLPTGCDAVTLIAGTTTVLDQQNELAGTTYSFTYEGTPTIDVGFIKPGYIPRYIRNLPLGSTDTSIPVALTADRNYA
ncbi:hypothetical protein E6Q11_06145 [Candidatus Dojkabacteria bacterium]|uniref:Uncharacterized protein n=1 Tax=Candidatus Dojkabacteria bacterium TaxID=2099670 RepID=A0A5C7J345_9BACT|nr:MAG: hypothetical protein E6Q11_06145 [Candidatus Dojkabacteria bacterium]